MSPFTKVYCIGLYQLCAIFTIVHIEHVMHIYQPLAFHFYGGYEDAGKGLIVRKQVLAIGYWLSVTSET